jgi:hypothetical protein
MATKAVKAATLKKSFVITSVLRQKDKFFGFRLRGQTHARSSGNELGLLND